VPTASYMAGLEVAGSTVGEYRPVEAAERMAAHAEDVAAPNSLAVHAGSVVLAARTAAKAGTMGNTSDTAQYAGRMGVAESAAVGTGKIGESKSTSGPARGSGEAGSNNRNRKGCLTRRALAGPVTAAHAGPMYLLSSYDPVCSGWNSCCHPCWDDLRHVVMCFFFLSSCW